ncbi:hypothetical protein [Verminephrobacter eiseniae]|uniref:hypothetical protein n=1 Tax=Verminephrobacter eiseniae TaxID=364317 RepID=UPI0022370FF5|nr:hypothetical protein [Verminephrobacter eiseniae]
MSEVAAQDAAVPRPAAWVQDMRARFSLVSRHRSSVGLRWPSKRIAALHRLPIQLGMGKRCALRCAPMAARSLRHLIGDATLAAT